MKKLISLILALVLCFSLSATAFAAAIDEPEDPVLTEAEEEPTREEETILIRALNQLRLNLLPFIRDDVGVDDFKAGLLQHGL